MHTAITRKERLHLEICHTESLYKIMAILENRLHQENLLKEDKDWCNRTFFFLESITSTNLVNDS